jgi:hypothetical protein
VAKGDAIPDEHRVLRRVPGSKIEQDGRVSGAAFVRRPDEEGLSVEWRERAGDWPATQVQAIRTVIRREMRPSHRLAEVPVGLTRARVRESAVAFGMAVDLRFEHEPLATEGPWPEDVFHSEIFGTPEHEHLLATVIGDLIAECVSEKYLAIL